MNIFKRTIQMVLFASVLLVCIICTTNIVERKSSDFKYLPFFEQKEDFDVLFMGTSHVINGIFPMDLWNDYGIVSYNFGAHGNPIATSYWALKNALDYTKPSLVVIDVLGTESMEKVSSNSEYLHLSMDCFPISRTKIEGIYDLCDNKEYVDDNGINIYNHKWEFIWDFGKYHSRWTEIDENDFTNQNKTKEKGAESRIAVADPNNYTLISKEECLENNDTVGVAYLKKAIEECKEREIDVLLINIPYPSGEQEQRAAHSVYEIAEDYNVNYVNFVDMNNVINYEIDCYDSGSHLNPSGARKVTSYLGKYIKDNYSIPDRRIDANYQKWFEDFDEYMNFKIDNINSQESLDTELMLLADDDFSTCLYFKDGSAISRDERIHRLIKNLTVKREVSLTNEGVFDGAYYLLIVDNGKDNVFESYRDTEFNLNTSFGKVSFAMENEVPKLNINDAEKNSLEGEWFAADSVSKEPDVQIVVVNNYTNEIVSSTKWDSSEKNSFVKRE